MTTEPRNIFTARSAKAEMRSMPLDDVVHMVDTCTVCGSQAEYVTIQAPEPGDVGWALTPEQARRLAHELLRVADGATGG